MQTKPSRMSTFIVSALVLYSYFLIEASLPHLPSRIPTHFSFAGKPDQWGSPSSLWVILGLQVLITVILLSIPTLGRRFPQAVHFGTRSLKDYTPKQRELIMPLLANMSGLMSVASGLFFVYLIRETIRVAEMGHPQMHMEWALGLFLGSMIGLPLYYWRRINTVVEMAQER